MYRTLCVVIAGLLGASAGATPFWVAYEGDAFPEDVGWERNFGAYDDPPQSFAHRSIEDGVFILDSLHDDQIYDYYIWNGVPDPGPGELLVAEWRLRVDPASEFMDTSFQIATTSLGLVYFKHGDGGVYVNYADYWPNLVFIPYLGGTFHTFRCEIDDMGRFRFSVDDEQVFQNWLLIDPIPVISSRIAFGDGVQGAASRQEWDCVRFGLVPEPSWLLTFATASAASIISRRRRCLRDLSVF